MHRLGVEKVVRSGGIKSENGGGIWRSTGLDSEKRIKKIKMYRAFVHRWARLGIEKQ